MSVKGVSKERSNPVRRPEVVARIKKMIATDRNTSNGDIGYMVLKEFQIVATMGQISGALYREGIYRGTVRGGRPVICPDGTDENRREAALARSQERDRMRASRSSAEIAANMHGLARRAAGDAALAKATRAAALANTITATPTLPPLVSMGSFKMPARTEPAPIVVAKPRSCLWPIGEPGASGFRFCDVPHTTGRSYCRDHCDVAYIRVRDRREDLQRGATA